MLILSGGSVDRLLALALHLRYSMVVTVPRVIKIAVCLWIVSIAVATLKFWMSKWVIIPALTLVLAFLITTLRTLKIFQIVRRHQRQITHLQQQRVQSNTINLLKYKKPAVTVLYVYGLFIIFYLPFCTTLFVETCTGYTLAVNESPMTTTTVVSLIHV